jgi:phosphonatase-like hydrolase
MLLMSHFRPINHIFVNRSIKLIVCNMGGTTVNESVIIYKTLFNTIKGFNIYIEDNAIQKWYGTNKTEVLQYYINNDNEYRHNETILPQMLDKFKKEIKKSYFEEGNIKLMDPKIPELFNLLRDKGIKIALNTGYSRDIQEGIIQKLEMDKFIDGYISSEDVSYGKPKPFMIQKLMKHFNIDDPNHVIKIGDSINDILEGKNSKCNMSVGVLSGTENKKKLIDNGADIVLKNIMHLGNHVE